MVKSVINKKIIAKIGDQYTKVKAGTKIIDRNEKVTRQHIAILKAMQQALNEEYTWTLLNVISATIIAGLFVLAMAIYLRKYHANVFNSIRALSLLTTIFISMLLLAKVVDHCFSYTSYPVLIVPATLLTAVLIDIPVAIFASICLIVLMTLSLSVYHSYFLVINIFVAFFLLYFATNLQKRNQIFSIVIKVYCAIIPLIVAFHLSSDAMLNTSLMLNLGLSFLYMFASTILVIGMLPMLEVTFAIFTNMTFQEYIDPNNALLSRLALEIPGTYQHSLVLSNFTEAMARDIGADALLCKVGSLYHDIGKLVNPSFFSENMTEDLHHALSPKESCDIIVSHVSEGEKLALQYRLPQPIIDIIREHHGDTLVNCFYFKEKVKNQSVNEQHFRYPGPKPQTKEAVIVMIADAIEAASRSLDMAGEADLRKLIDDIIKDRLHDNQFNESNITFKEIEQIKDSMFRVLLSTHHIRIKYPPKQ